MIEKLKLLSNVNEIGMTKCRIRILELQNETIKLDIKLINDPDNKDAIDKKKGLLRNILENEKEEAEHKIKMINKKLEDDLL